MIISTEISNLINNAAGITAAALTINNDTAVGGGVPNAAGVILIDSEQISYTANAAGVITVAVGGRGYNGTTAATHADNAKITMIGNPVVPTGHNRWMKHVPTATGTWRYSGGADALPIVPVGETKFAGCIRYLRFSAPPTANTSCFIALFAAYTGAGVNTRKILLRTDMKLDMLVADGIRLDTSVETLAHSTNYAVIMTMDTNYAGKIRTQFYYSTDDEATFTVITWNRAGTATGVTATTLTDSTMAGIWQTNEYAGRTVTMGGSTGTIQSNTDTVLTIDAWSAGTPAAGAYTMNALEYVDTEQPGDQVGAIEAAGMGLASFSALDNGINTFFSEAGVILASEWLGPLPLKFCVGKLQATGDATDGAAYLEWVPQSGGAHYLEIQGESGAGGRIDETVANQQEVHSFAATTTTNLPTGNTVLAIKQWLHLYQSTGLPDATNLQHLVKDNGAYYSYNSHDYLFGSSNLCSAVSLRYMPGGGGRWTAARIDAIEAGADKVGDDTLNYRMWKNWINIVSISNPASIATLVKQNRSSMRAQLVR